MIEELVQLANPRDGCASQLNREESELVQLAQQLASDAQSTTPRHTLRVHACDREITGFWDRTLLSRAIENLLANAIKYSPECGDMTLTLRRAGMGSNALALLTVQDDGIGISQEDQLRIFARCARGLIVSEGMGGTGLGLAIVSQIVDQHGGAMTVKSEPSRGAAFTMSLPLRSA